MVYRVSQKNPATPHKMVSFCRYIYYIIYWLVLLWRQCSFTQLCKVSLSKSKWLFQNLTFTNITQKSICTGFGRSTIVNANTIAWHLLQINPFNTKVSAAKHIIDYFFIYYILNYAYKCNAYILQKMTIDSIWQSVPLKTVWEPMLFFTILSLT